jgi:hypothetical protein
LSTSVAGSWVARYSQRRVVGLDDLDLVLALDLARQAQADAAAAGDHHALDRPVAAAQRAQHAADVLGGGQHEDLVAGLDARVPSQSCGPALRSWR